MRLHAVQAFSIFDSMVLEMPIRSEFSNSSAGVSCPVTGACYAVRPSRKRGWGSARPVARSAAIAPMSGVNFAP